MAKLESIIKSEITRLAKHEVRSVFRPLRKEVWGMKLKLSNLIKGFTVLDRLAKEISKAKSAEPKLEASPEEVKASRITPDRIRGLRKKLGISQRELGVLVGATIGAVASWEKGKFKPKGEKKAALVALRKLRKRDVRKMVTEKAGAKEERPIPKKRTVNIKKKKVAKRK
jgi:DNA-binding transcriptional regulator YiaG